MHVVRLLPSTVEEAIVVVGRGAAIDGIIRVDAQMDTNFQSVGIEFLFVALGQHGQETLIVVVGTKDLRHFEIRCDIARCPHANHCKGCKNAQQWELERSNLSYLASARSATAAEGAFGPIRKGHAGHAGHALGSWQMQRMNHETTSDEKSNMDLGGLGDFETK